MMFGLAETCELLLTAEHVVELMVIATQDEVGLWNFEQTTARCVAR